MSSPILMSAFETISEKKPLYCFLCFRTENERKLKIPQPSLKTVTYLGFGVDINDKPARICYMCENIANAAVIFRSAAFNASSIDCLFKGMIESEPYKKDVKQHFQNAPFAKKNLRTSENFDNYETQLKRLREYKQLRRTDVILIQCLEVMPQDTINETYSVPPKRALERNEREEENNDKEVESVKKEVQSSNSDDVVEIIDALPPRRNKTPTRELPKPTFKKKKVRVASANAPLMSKLLKNIGIKTANKIEDKKEKEIERKVTRRIRKKVTMEFEKEMEREMKMARERRMEMAREMKMARQRRMEMAREMKMTRERRVEMERERRMEIRKQIRIPNGRKPGRPRKYHFESAPLTEPSQEEKCFVVSETEAGNGRVLGNEAVKAPVLNVDKIDWEDKIPMDVISFMDATDPNPPSFTKIPQDQGPETPTVGVTDVGSLQNELLLIEEINIKNETDVKDEIDIKDEIEITEEFIG